jgi:hypothetical protein
VDGGDIQVNSDSDRAACIIGDAVIDAPEMNVVGDTRLTGNTTYDGILNPNSPYKPDPLCPDPPDNCLPEPAWDSTLDLSPATGAVTKITEGTHELIPGYYSGGLNITGGDVTLQPGMYVVDGDGFQVSGNTNLCAKGVMFYIIGQGRLDLTGTGDMVITPLTGNDPNFCNPAYDYPPGTDYLTYEGMTFFQARDNDQPARIVGTSQMDLEGTLYFPYNHLDVSGTSDGLGNQLIAWTIEVSGTGELTINYDGRNPAPGYHSYLVE